MKKAKKIFLSVCFIFCIAKTTYAQVCFNPAILLNGGPNPQGIAIADYNSDGKFDFAIANNQAASGTTSETFMCLGLGNGKGGFDTVTVESLSEVLYHAIPSSITSADFNMDGKPDVAVTMWSTNYISIMLGNGSSDLSFGKGNFDFRHSKSFQTGGFPVSIISTDFNSDAKPDLAVANYNSNTISIFLGVGDGSFNSLPQIPVNINPQSVISADFNGDGKADLATANSTSNDVSILLGDGKGGFSAAKNFPAGTAPFSIISADFNGDNKPDLVVTDSGTDSVSIFLGDGKGSFGSGSNFLTGASPISVVSADFNKDGKLDLAVANQGTTNISILCGDGTGGFSAASNFPTHGADASFIATADFNKDGKPDLIVANSSTGNLSLLINCYSLTTNMNDITNVPLISIYLNPATDNITIEITPSDIMTSPEHLLQVFDITGKLMLAQNIKTGKTIISTGSLTQGVYNICISGNEQKTNRRVVILK